jgi:hypothetical protein
MQLRRTYPIAVKFQELRQKESLRLNLKKRNESLSSKDFEKEPTRTLMPALSVEQRPSIKVLVQRTKRVSTPKEAIKSAAEFFELASNKKSMTPFFRHLASNRALDSAKFLLRMKAVANSRTSYGFKSGMNEVYSTFLKEGSESEINISAADRSRFKEAVESGNKAELREAFSISVKRVAFEVMEGLILSFKMS